MRSLSVASGYYKNPDATTENFVEGSFKTGDLSTVQEERFMTLVDRKNTSSSAAASNVYYPMEVEQALFRHEKVLEAERGGDLDRQLDGWAPRRPSVRGPRRLTRRRLAEALPNCLQDSGSLLSWVGSTL